MTPVAMPEILLSMFPVEKTARPVPVPDEVSAPFWAAAAAGELHIQHCPGCARYQHPPEPLCRGCCTADLRFVPVSGRARLHSWTLTCSGARHPAFDGAPYVVGLAELVEQEGLFLYTNLPGAPVTFLIKPGEGLQATGHGMTCRPCR
jgi:hypothetical protein